MGLASQSEIDQAVMQAKKDLTIEEVKEAVRRCSYGGKSVGMSLKGLGTELKGGVCLGKTNT
jgi:hypothetical protein